MLTTSKSNDATIGWRTDHAPKRTFAFVTALCFIALAVVSIGFLRSVLSRPQRTPLLTLSTCYDSEWDLNAWVDEDLRRIEDLGESTFRVKSIPGIERLAAGLWDETDNALRDAVDLCPDQHAIAVYINAHGAVDDHDRPCLIPANASPNDSETWIPLDALLNHLMRVQDTDCQKRILLVLECGKIRTHWAAGIDINDFADRLDDLVSQFASRNPNRSLAVLTSSGPGEQSFASQHGDGDVFTRFVVEGLRGNADGFGDQNVPNGIIDTAELGEYVRHHTLTWSKAFRGQSQTPRLICSGKDRAFSICAVSRRRDSALASTGAPSAKQLDELTTATKRVSRLREHNAGALDGQAWSTILRTHHALRQSVFGGLAVRKKTMQIHSLLERQVAALEKKVDAHQKNNAVPGQIDTAANAWNALALSPNLERAKQLAVTIAAVKHPTPVPMLHTWVQEPDLSLWSHSDVLQGIAKAQAKWCETIDRMPNEFGASLNQTFKIVHKRRRQLADAVLTNRGSRSGLQENVHIAIDAFCSEVNRCCELMEQVRSAWELRNLALAEVPLLLQQKHLDSSNNGQSADKHRGFETLLMLDDLLSQMVHQQHVWSVSDLQKMADLASKTRVYLRDLTGQQDLALKVDVDRMQSDSQMPCQLAMAMQCNHLCLDAHEHARRERIVRDWDKRSLDPFPSLDNTTADKPNSADAKSADHDKHSHHLSKLLRINAIEFSSAAAREKLRRFAELPITDNEKPASDWHRVVAIASADELFGVMVRDEANAAQCRYASEAKVVLDDFWYGPQHDGVPYFYFTANHLLVQADGITAGDSSWKRTRDELKRQVEARLVASQNGLQVHASRAESDVGKTSRVVIALDSDHEASVYPKGDAAVLIGDDCVTIRLGETSGDPTKRTAQLTLPKRSEQLRNATLAFRGHEYLIPIQDGQRKYVVETEGSDSNLAARITFAESISQRRSICFVLDCSASMNDAVDAELGSSHADVTKLDAARTALMEMMRRLQPENTDVGLVLYGHRMATGTGDDGLLLQKRYHKQFPFSSALRPYEDVELAMPTGRFGVEQLAMARQHLDATVPWGQTPLYLAINRAIDDLGRLPNATAKDVVVVSDGQNYQFNPTADAIMSIDDLVAAAKRRGVRVHLIGFGIASQEIDAATIAFQKIATGTGGKSNGTVARASKLLEELDALTRKSEFVVEAPSSAQQIARLGESISLDDVASANAPLRIAFNGRTETVPVYAGNDLRLLLSSDGQRLTSVNYRTGLPVFAPLVTSGGDATDYHLAFHAPKRESGDVRFQFSLQSTNGSVAPRPKLMWLEMHAQNSVDAVRDDHVYRSGSVTWVAGTPCPVGEIVCRDWPHDADRVRAHVWCSLNQPEGTRIGLDTTSGDFGQLGQWKGVSYSVETKGERQRVVLKQDSSTGSQSRFIVKPIAANAGKAIHTYAESGGLSIHEFTQPIKEKLTLQPTRSSTKLEVWIYSVDQLKSSGIHTEHSIERELQMQTVAQLRADSHAVRR